MRFQKGVRFGWRRPRGRGRGTYNMSRAAYEARLRNLGRVQRPRAYDDTRRLEIEIALASHRGESYRAMATRLGCSHVHCCRVAERYRRGLLPLLPRDEQELLRFRDSLYGDEPPQPAPESSGQSSPEAHAEPPAYVIPERYRDFEKWKEQYYAERPWLRKFRPF